jgi:hypothetical protein
MPEVVSDVDFQTFKEFSVEKNFSNQQHQNVRLFYSLYELKTIVL